MRKFVESKIGLLYQYPECDKYTFKGVIRWEFGRPYLIAHDDDGYCIHLDKESYRCTVWEQRPVPCLGFDCEDNEKWKVWADYGEKIVNDGLMERIDKDNRTVYNGSKLK